MHLEITTDEFDESIINVIDKNGNLLLTKRVTESIDQLIQIYQEQHRLHVQNDGGVYILEEKL